MPNKAHQPTDENRAEVKALASFGLPQEDIAEYVGVSHVTLRKHYASELKLSAIKANATVGKYLFSLASGQAISKGATHSDCKTAAMFWAKTRMGWRETNNLDVTTNGKDILPTEIVIRGVQPDVSSAD